MILDSNPDIRHDSNALYQFIRPSLNTELGYTVKISVGDPDPHPSLFS
jgi:hypothetical protein